MEQNIGVAEYLSIQISVMMIALDKSIKYLFFSCPQMCDTDWDELAQFIYYHLNILFLKRRGL